MQILNSFCAFLVAVDQSDGSESDSEDDEADEEYELLEPRFMAATSYVRDLFKYFKKSPLKMSQAQVLIKEGEGKELALLLDVRTRWNSVLPMIQRYLLVNKYIKKCLEMLNEGQRYSVKHDETLKDLAAALEPIQEAVLELSKHSSNLLIADATVKYVIGRLRSLNSRFSLTLCDAVITRYTQRRLRVEIGLLSLLTTKEFPEETADFENVTKKEIKDKAHELYAKLFVGSSGLSQQEQQQQVELEIDFEEDEEVQVIPKSASLAEGISNSMKPKVDTQTQPQLNLRQDFNTLVVLGQLTTRLESIRDALLSIQPTSTICEQSFSIADAFKCKKRNRMGTKRTNALVWLKRYFSEQ